MKKIAIIGTNGIPSKYGGFETLAEYLVKYLSQKYEITVFCSSITNPYKIHEYRGCNLKYIPFKANGWQSIPFDIISILRSYKCFDKILILGVSGCILLPFLYQYKSKFILNFGGLEWKRSKWNYITRKFLKLSEYLAIKCSSQLIADNLGIQEYILCRYGRNSTLIEYGGDQVKVESLNEKDKLIYPFLNKPYAFSVARIQPDNNVDLILKVFSDKPLFTLVFVGNWSNSNYGRNLQQKFAGYPNIYLIDAIYDSYELNKIRSNCKVYIHGHSAGGTNPSLVEAMNLGLPIIAFASVFNEYTTEYQSVYFSNVRELKQILNNINNSELESIGKKMKEIAERRYKWGIIAEKYAGLFKN
jgi:glycosyltransferase involved in cell wall biosynthesis